MLLKLVFIHISTCLAILEDSSTEISGSELPAEGSQLIRPLAVWLTKLAS